MGKYRVLSISFSHHKSYMSLYNIRFSLHIQYIRYYLVILLQADLACLAGAYIPTGRESKYLLSYLNTFLFYSETEISFCSK